MYGIIQNKSTEQQRKTNKEGGGSVRKIVLAAFLLTRAAACLAWSVVLEEKMVYEISVLGFKPKTETYFLTDSLRYVLEPEGETCYRFVSYNRLDSRIPFVSLREGKYESYTRVRDLTSARFSRYFVHNDRSESLSVRFDSDSAHEKNQATDCHGKTDSSEQVVGIGGKIHDLINILIYVRSRDLCLGETLRVYTFAEDGGKPYWLPLVVDTQTVVVPAGKFNCWRVKYLASRCGIFDGSVGDFEVWIASDSGRTVPQMRWQTKLWFKSVYITAKLKEVK